MAALSFQRPGMTPLHVSANGVGGPIAISLFGETHEALSRQCRRPMHGSATISADRSGSPNAIRPRLRKGGVQYPERDAAPTSFVDNYGILVISEASHAALNQKLPQAVPMNRFRPNIVVSGVDEHEEDYFTNVRCGEVALRFINPCFRCSLTSIDQKSGDAGT